MSSRYLNTVSHWYGRFGNNIQQICNGIIYSSINGDGFFSPHHDLIEQIVIGSQKKTTTRQCRFFHYNTPNKDFDIDLNYLYQNIGKVAKQYVDNIPGLAVADKGMSKDPLNEHLMQTALAGGTLGRAALVLRILNAGATNAGTLDEAKRLGYYKEK